VAVFRRRRNLKLSGRTTNQLDMYILYRRQTGLLMEQPIPMLQKLTRYIGIMATDIFHSLQSLVEDMYYIMEIMA